MASRAWVLPLHSLLAPEAQLKVLRLVRVRARVRVGDRVGVVARVRFRGRFRVGALCLHRITHVHVRAWGHGGMVQMCVQVWAQVCSLMQLTVSLPGRDFCTSPLSLWLLRADRLELRHQKVAWGRGRGVKIGLMARAWG